MLSVLIFYRVFRAVYLPPKFLNAVKLAQPVQVFHPNGQVDGRNAGRVITFPIPQFPRIAQQMDFARGVTVSDQFHNFN